MIRMSGDGPAEGGSRIGALLKSAVAKDSPAKETETPMSQEEPSVKTDETPAQKALRERNEDLKRKSQLFALRQTIAARVKGTPQKDIEKQQKEKDPHGLASLREAGSTFKEETNK